MPGRAVEGPAIWAPGRSSSSAGTFCQVHTHMLCMQSGDATAPAWGKPQPQQDEQRRNGPFSHPADPVNINTTQSKTSCWRTWGRAWTA